MCKIDLSHLYRAYLVFMGAHYICVVIGGSLCTNEMKQCQTT